MPIVSSALTLADAQRDGRRWAEERHTDQLGLVYVYRYLADAGTDTAAIMAARAPQVAAELERIETSGNVVLIAANGSAASLSTAYATLAQVRAALRAAYAAATRMEAIMIGDYLASLTDAQLQSLFGMTAGQVNNLRTNKLTPAANAAATIRAAAGA